MVSVNLSDNKINNSIVDLKMSNHEITIELNSYINSVNVEIFDLSGRQIKKESYSSTSKIQMQTNNIPTGIYIVRLSNNSGLNLTRKIQIR